MRPGTVPAMLACGFGAAAELAIDEQPADAQRLERLTERLRRGLDAMALPVHCFGADDQRAPGTLSFGFAGISGDQLVALVASEIAISTGAACSSADASVSHVLAALGCSHDQARTGVRMGLGRFTTEADIGVALDAFGRVALRAA